MSGAAAAIQVMVVEDADDVRDALCEMLAFEGYHPIGCRTGESAWTQLACGLRPRVIITDVALPGLSGRQLVKLIREQAWGRDVPVLLLSAWERADRLGIAADIVLAKCGEPVAIARAVDRLARWERFPTRRPPLRKHPEGSSRPADHARTSGDRRP